MKRKDSFMGLLPMMILCLILFKAPEIQAGDSRTALAKTSSRPKPSVMSFQRGQTLYNRHCAVCHGLTGQGDGPAAYLLYPKPRDFRTGHFRLISTKSGEPSDDDLFQVLTRGMPGSSMPSWEHLSETDRWALVDFVRFLSHYDPQMMTPPLLEDQITLHWDTITQWLTPPSDDDLIRVVVSSPDDESLRRGRDLFLQSCAGCHGPEGLGDGQQAMIDDSGLPTRPRNLRAGILKGRADPRSLYLRLAAGMPGSPMPRYQDVLTEQQIWDLVHYVRSLIPADEVDRHQLKSLTIRVAPIPNQEIPLDPTDAIWETVEPVEIPLTPLWWHDEAVFFVKVQAVHNKDRIAFRLSWRDPVVNDDIIHQQSFSDGVAIQFSQETDPPFFGMGEADHPVTFWYWKAAWQKPTQDVDTLYPHMTRDHARFPAGPIQQNGEPTSYLTLLPGQEAGNPLSTPQRPSVETATARGLGTYTSDPSFAEDLQALGHWQDGEWAVVFLKKLKNEKDDVFRSGRNLKVCFAVWDGAQQDRNGQKNVSIWNTLVIQPADGSVPSE